MRKESIFIFFINKNYLSKKAWHQPLTYILEYLFSSNARLGIVKCGVK